MTLANTVFLPQTVLPLYIFESRYRRMLADSLASHRSFVVANLRSSDSEPTSLRHEIPCAIATLGLIRLSSLNPDGTSTLMLHGSQRIRIDDTLQASPYPIVKVSALPSETDLDPLTENQLRLRFTRMIEKLCQLTGYTDPGLVEVCNAAADLESLIHFAMNSFCNSASINQTILEATSGLERFQLAERFLHRQIALLTTSQSDLSLPSDDQANFN